METIDVMMMMIMMMMMMAGYTMVHAIRFLIIKITCLSIS